MNTTEPSDIIYRGPRIDDNETFEACPEELERLLRKWNGLIAYKGGLHVRGACTEPEWHSLREAWHGEHAFHRHYPTITPYDVPFAEDYLGDQFFLRDTEVIRLSAETGEVQPLYITLEEFMEACERDPMGFLGLHPLVEWQHGDNELHPGQLLSIYPPLCCEEAAEGVTVEAVPVVDRLSFLADLSRQVRAAKSGHSS